MRSGAKPPSWIPPGATRPSRTWPQRSISGNYPKPPPRFPYQAKLPAKCQAEHRAEPLTLEHPSTHPLHPFNSSPPRVEAFSLNSSSSAFSLPGDGMDTNSTNRVRSLLPRPPSRELLRLTARPHLPHLDPSHPSLTTSPPMRTLPIGARHPLLTKSLPTTIGSAERSGANDAIGNQLPIQTPPTRTPRSIAPGLVHQVAVTLVVGELLAVVTFFSTESASEHARRRF